MGKPLVVAEGMQVKLHFALHLQDGSEVDSTWSKAPATFEVGDGNLPIELEKLLMGMKEGQSLDHQMPADSLFGTPRDEHRVWLPRSHFPEDMPLEIGMVVSFGGAITKGESVGVIKVLNEARALVDFNHPLAGQMIAFKAEILQIQAL